MGRGREDERHYDDDFDDDRQRGGAGDDRRSSGRMSRADLRKIARAQRSIILCILVIFIILGAFAVLAAVQQQQRPNPNVRVGQAAPVGEQAPLVHVAIYIALGASYVIAGLYAMISVFSLAMKVYGTGPGIAMAICTLFPCIGLIILVIINAMATSILRKNGVRVGFLGARMSDLQ
jgi:hypothetical protein